MPEIIMKRLKTLAPADQDFESWAREMGLPMPIIRFYDRISTAAQRVVTAKNIKTACEMLRIEPTWLLFGKTWAELEEEWDSYDPDADVAAFFGVAPTPRRLHVRGSSTQGVLPEQGTVQVEE